MVCFKNDKIGTFFRRAAAKFYIVQAGGKSIKQLYYDGIFCPLDCITAFSQHLSLCEESPCWAEPPLLSSSSFIWKTIQSARMRNPVLFKTLSYGDLQTEGVRADEVRERQHSALCQLASVHRSWHILSGPECFTSDSISNSTWQTFTGDNRTLNCML